MVERGYQDNGLYILQQQAETETSNISTHRSSNATPPLPSRLEETTGEELFSYIRSRRGSTTDVFSMQLPEDPKLAPYVDVGIGKLVLNENRLDDFRAFKRTRAGIRKD